MKRNTFIKLNTQVLPPNCLHYLWGHYTIICFIYSTFDGIEVHESKCYCEPCFLRVPGECKPEIGQQFCMCFCV